VRKKWRVEAERKLAWGDGYIDILESNAARHSLALTFHSMDYGLKIKCG